MATLDAEDTPNQRKTKQSHGSYLFCMMVFNLPVRSFFFKTQIWRKVVIFCEKHTDPTIKWCSLISGSVGRWLLRLSSSLHSHTNRLNTTLRYGVGNANFGRQSAPSSSTVSIRHDVVLFNTRHVSHSCLWYALLCKWIISTFSPSLSHTHTHTHRYKHTLDGYLSPPVLWYHPRCCLMDLASPCSSSSLVLWGRQPVPSLIKAPFLWCSGHGRWWFKLCADKLLRLKLFVLFMFFLFFFIFVHPSSLMFLVNWMDCISHEYMLSVQEDL